MRPKSAKLRGLRPYKYGAFEGQSDILYLVAELSKVFTEYRNMFIQNILPTIALGASIASALLLDTPSGTLVAGGPMEVAWESTASDPTEFTLFLLNAANLPFGLEADFGEIETSAGSVTVTLPDTLTTKSYQLRAVNSSSVDFVYASSADFVITLA